MKMIQRPFIKIKRLSKRRKKILLGRDITTHLRQKWERDKVQAILESVVTINLKTLKIMADPKIDVNYVRGMSAMSIYGHNYRRPTGENISEDSVHIRPDVTNKLSNLDINDKNDRDRNVNASQQNIEIEVLQRTSCLRINDNNEPSIHDRIKNISMSEE